jgi:L-ectoine synthase
MIVRRLDEILFTEHHVSGETWSSRRLLLHKDNVGFSLHDTVMRAGTDTVMWYKHHIEAVYCISGEGEIEDISSGTIHTITPGTLYVLDGNEKHRVRPKTDLRLICVFNPPCTGKEVHDDEGAYPLFLN